jgi:hypothetical protein
MKPLPDGHVVADQQAAIAMTFGTEPREDSDFATESHLARSKQKHWGPEITWEAECAEYEGVAKRPDSPADLPESMH